VRENVHQAVILAVKLFEFKNARWPAGVCREKRSFPFIFIANNGLKKKRFIKSLQPFSSSLNALQY
jgi:hypothetical protein